MALGLLVLITALSISAVAIYYSVAGLVAIFAAAALPIMIMGGVLEVGKLVTAVWLHRYWKQATWWLRTYLATAVVVLMLITSMGIFGFLSKAHIEQTSAGQESIAQVERLTAEISRQSDIIKRAEEKISQLESSGTGSDANIQAQIDAEQERIDKAYERVQPAIDEQQKIIDSQGQLYKDELARIDEQLSTLQSYIDAGDKESIKKAQAMIGARQDGAWGSRTAAAAENWRKDRQQARSELLTKIEQATNNPQAQAALNEIKRLRQTVETQIANSNTLINRLRTQISQTDKAADIDAEVDEQNARIKNANAEIDRLTEEKYALEGEYRKLEAEVGPIKYIAEFIYGEQADTNMLEEAVRWVIITIIFVFDPLAVLLLIASQYTFAFNRKDDSGDRLRLEREEYERARAQRIVDNPGFDIGDPKEETYETGETTSEEKQQDAEELRDRQAEERLPSETGDDSDVVETTPEERSIEDVAQSYISDEKQVEEFLEQANQELEEEIQKEESSIQKKDDIIPDTKNKVFYPDELDPNATYVTKDEFGNQIRKYKQNEEQDANSIWQRIQRDKE